MGEVSNSASGSSKRREEFDEAEKDDKVFCGDGEKEIDIDGPIGEEPPVGQKESVDSSEAPITGTNWSGEKTTVQIPAPTPQKKKYRRNFGEPQ